MVPALHKRKTNPGLSHRLAVQQEEHDAPVGVGHAQVIARARGRAVRGTMWSERKECENRVSVVGRNGQEWSQPMKDL